MRERLRVAVRGAVQGVGFRPFVFRLAGELGLDGWVSNSPQHVLIEVEGAHDALQAFLNRVQTDQPPRAVIQGLESTWLDPLPHTGFEIRTSAQEGAVTTLVLPDMATCADCCRELRDPGDRRYRYPFTNCTNCGPRFSIIEGLPYDRARTSMRAFDMCPACRREYEHPADRRFHAQPNACPVCGPQLALWDATGRTCAVRDDALQAAVSAIRDGAIVAAKGLGGFQLLVDALQEPAVARLRMRKHREEKPLALMYPSLEAAKRHCRVSPLEAGILRSPEAPIVLVRCREAGYAELAPSVAPGSPFHGVMLPYTPLHHLLLDAVAGPVVATSGNISDEPMCVDEREVLERLGDVADLFLVHNRPIVRHVDDSIVRILAGRPVVLRRARGFAPLPITVAHDTPSVIALGAHQKNTVAVTAGANVFISQHVGDLDTAPAVAAFRSVLESLQNLYHIVPACVLADAHPDYASTKHAQTLGLPIVSIQHHYAHVAACLAENELDGRVLGVCWDGTGYGSDGTIWGGEFLTTSDAGFSRFACLRPFRVPGGDRGVREPRRSAFGALWTATSDEPQLRGELLTLTPFGEAERRVLQKAIERGINAPVTTSAGRLFDAVASLTGLRHHATFEGQAAMALEWSVDERVTDGYPWRLDDDIDRFAPSHWARPAVVADWGPMILAIVDDVRRAVPTATITARFHNTLAEIIVGVATRAGESRVLLTGGCFQNGYLTERCVQGLQDRGFRPYWHQRVPPNDGGISLGQVAAHRRADSARPRARAGSPGRQPVDPFKEP
ncbi:MAG: carbamoyltransferase HypF [Vicinamibacterales bacterium]